MATTPSLQQAFQVLASNAELSASTAQKISDRYNSIRNQLLSELPGTTVHQIGSFQRQTKINPTPPHKTLDLDISLVFDTVEKWQLTQYEPARLMQQVMRALTRSRIYKTMRPKRDAPVVIVEYNDDTTVEIVPCVAVATIPTARPAYYYVPDGFQSWKTADYDYDARMISQLNQSPNCNGRLVPNIKIVKAFLRRANRFGLSSWNVEVLCAKIIPEVLRELDTRWWDWGYNDVLVEFLCRVPRFVALPSILDGSMSTSANYHLSSQQILDISNRYMKVGTHFRSINDKPVREAWNTWRNWFGPVFPAL